MIDEAGYRANVGIVLLNKHNRAFWGRRSGQTSWQFPQGGVNESESPIQAMYRELYEEVGLKPQHVEVIAATQDWLHYRLPENLVRKKSPMCIGQKQKWFLLRLISDDEVIDLRANQKPEFDEWRWVAYWYPIDEVVNFKKDVYEKALTAFAKKLYIPIPKSLTE